MRQDRQEEKILEKMENDICPGNKETKERRKGRDSKKKLYKRGREKSKGIVDVTVHMPTEMRKFLVTCRLCIYTCTYHFMTSIMTLYSTIF